MQTLEELRERMGITKPPGSLDLWITEEVANIWPGQVGKDQDQLG